MGTSYSLGDSAVRGSQEVPAMAQRSPQGLAGGLWAHLPASVQFPPLCFRRVRHAS